MRLRTRASPATVGASAASFTTGSGIRSGDAEAIGCCHSAGTGGDTGAGLLVGAACEEAVAHQPSRRSGPARPQLSASRSCRLSSMRRGQRCRPSQPPRPGRRRTEPAGVESSRHPLSPRIAAIRDTNEAPGLNGRRERGVRWSSTSRSRFPRGIATSTSSITRPGGSGSTACCSRRPAIRPTTDSSTTPSATTATHSTRSCCSTNRPFPVVSSSAARSACSG